MMVYKSQIFFFSCTVMYSNIKTSGHTLLENILNSEQVMLLNLTAAFMNLSTNKTYEDVRGRRLSVKHLYSIFVNYIALGFPWSYLAISLPGKQYSY